MVGGLVPRGGQGAIRLERATKEECYTVFHLHYSILVVLTACDVEKTRDAARGAIR